MKKKSMNALIKSALQRMKQDGASEKMLKIYQTTGFGAIIRYCKKNNIHDYDETVIGEFVNQTRDEYENGKISKWKWQLVRRGGELLKHFNETATHDFPPCEKWEVLYHPLHREPTQDELLDAKNIITLVWHTKQEMTKFNLTPKTVNNYQYDGFDRILRGHIDNGLTQYSKELAEDLVVNARNGFEDGKISRSAYQTMRRTAALLNEFYETNNLTWHYLPAYGLREPRTGFAELLLKFCNDASRTGKIKSSTINATKSTIRRFLFEFEDIGIYSFENVTPQIVSERVTNFARGYTGGLGAMLYGVRIFLKFLHSSGITKENLSVALPEMIARKKPIREGFSGSDVETLFDHIDKSTSIGKRDYAIMMLALQTGLRACDIADLKRRDINWRTKEICIAQTKTGRALTLYLPPESGNAIADYILNVRPKCGATNVFLCKDRPFRPISNRSVSSIVSRYMQKSGVAESPIPRRGFHSFRRTFGKQLLESETSLDMLNELLGHFHMDSSRPYIAIDEEGLKKCCLNLIDIKKERDDS